MARQGREMKLGRQELKSEKPIAPDKKWGRAGFLYKNEVAKITRRLREAGFGLGQKTME